MSLRPTSGASAAGPWPTAMITESASTSPDTVKSSSNATPVVLALDPVHVHPLHGVVGDAIVLQ